MNKRVSIGIAVILFIVVLIESYLLLVHSQHSFVVYELGDGRTVLALRDLNEVYPTFAATFKAEADLAYSQKGELQKATANGNYSQNVVKLYGDLDAITYQVRTTLATGYTGFVTSLGSSTTPEERRRAFDRWDAIQKEIIELTLRLRGINDQIAQAKSAVSNTEYDRLATMSAEARNSAKALAQLR